MVWSEEHDEYLCREIITIDPFTDTKKGTTQRSAKWSEIANTLSAIQTIPFKVDKRAVRDRYNLLAERFKRKMAAEEKSSGIDCQMSEVDKALENLTAKETYADEMTSAELAAKNSKVAGDREKAEEIRKKAMESLGKQMIITERNDYHEINKNKVGGINEGHIAWTHNCFKWVKLR